LIVIGKNSKLSFSITVNPSDQGDLYEEKIEGDFYVFNNTLLPLTYRTEYI